ncbi:MAG: hypothetical protein Q8L45_12550 [Xanthomonadaceae bacterium]|nr:hypothetical protein [Xanthomonadaceae bacterium]
MMRCESFSHRDNQRLGGFAFLSLEDGAPAGDNLRGNLFNRQIDVFAFVEEMAAQTERDTTDDASRVGDDR